jgi:hypothetical protein
MFWQHQQELLGTSSFDLPDLVGRIVEQHRNDSDVMPPTAISKVDGRIFICTNTEVPKARTLYPEAAFITLGEGLEAETLFKTASVNQYLHVSATDGKKGQKSLVSSVFPQADTFIKSALSNGFQVCISCPTGKDLSVAVALITLEKYFDDDGALVPGPRAGRHRIISLYSVSYLALYQ